MANRVQQLLAELRRRHVWRVALAYAAVAIAAVQGLDILVPAFGGPEWIMRAVLVVAVLGFPLVVALGWVYELTPQGIRRDERLPGQTTGVFARLAFLGLVVLSVVTVGWWSVRSVVSQDPPTATAPSSERAVADGVTPASTSVHSPIRSMAVLPLDDFSADGGSAYFAAGMHEALIAELARVPALRVISRTSVSRYDSTDLSLPEIGQELGADGIIEGSVVRDGNRVRITIQLIHASSDTHVWSNSYDGDMTDILGLQARVAEEIASEIQAELMPSDMVRTTSAYVASAEAQDAYMRGQAEALKGTPESMSAAREHFSEAVQHDSTFAPALAALAGTDAILQMDVGQGGAAPDMARLTEARELAYRALELDSASTEAVAAAALIEKHMAGLAEEIRANTGAEIQIVTEGLPEEEWVASFSELGRNWQMVAMQRAERAGTRTREPNLVSVKRLIIAGEAERAVDVLEEVVDERPDMTQAWLLLEEAQTAAGDFDEAAETVLHLANTDANMVSEEDALELEDAVDRDGAQGYWSWKLERLEERSEAGLPVPPSQFAMAHAALGSKDEAFSYIEMAFEARDPGLFSLRSHPAWDPVRHDPRFAQVVQRARSAPRPRKRPRSP